MSTATWAGAQTGSGAARVPKAKVTRAAVPRLRTDGVSPEARRQAAAILEVLAGVHAERGGGAAGRLADALLHHRRARLAGAGGGLRPAAAGARADPGE